MKRRIFALLIPVLCFGLLGCGSTASPPAHEGVPGAPPWPEDCPLEFWITENVEGVDWSGHDELAVFGAQEYLGLGYRALTDEGGWNPRAPDVSVSYTVTAYPDYSSGGQFVTLIRITDPAVAVYGLTVNSSLEEWDAVMREMGYKVSRVENISTRHQADKDGFSFFYGDGIIFISAEVANEQGIVF